MQDTKVSGLINIHSGSSFDDFLKEEKIELLEKAKCVRCGKPNMNGTKGGRCKACMDKLTTKRHTVGSKERAWNKADGAARRDRGENGTAHAKSKGRMKDRKAFIKRFQHNEKEAGSKLSPDRKQNDTGYTSSNVRNVPEKLNRGRHHVDPKKLRAWKKRLKKAEIDQELFFTALLAKANETADTALLDMLNNLGEDGVKQYVNIFDEPLDKSLKHSGIQPYDDIAYFDVNDTLLHKTSDKQEDSVKIEGVDKEHDGWHSPNKRNIELLKELKKKGHPIAVWSGAGYKMALEAVKTLKLEPHVDMVLAKPTIYVDNKPSPKFLKKRLWRDPEDPSKDKKDE